MSATAMPARHHEALKSFKHRLAETMVRSKLNFRDDLRVINILWDKFHVEKIACAEELRPLWRDLADSPPTPGAQSSLYLNIPYCREKCSFCKFQIRVAPGKGVLERYIADMIKEAEYFAPAASKVRFDFIQSGGGTPSLLTARQIRDLYGAAFRLFHVKKQALRSIEFHPASTTPAKLLAARQAGFNRVSFGVQSLDAKLLDRIRRGDQTERNVRAAMRWARKAGFDLVGVELIVGLQGDSLPQFIESAVKLMDERPNYLWINQLNLTTDYMKTEGIAPEPYFASRGRMLPEICEALKKAAARHGYRADGISATRGIWTLVRDDDQAAASPDGDCEATARVLGLGQSAWSHVPGRAWYARTTADFSPARPNYRMRRQTLDTAMAGYIRHWLINGSFIDFRSFNETFGLDFKKHYELELRLLELFGKIRLESAGVRFLCVDLTERFFYGSIFFLRQWARLSAGRSLLSPDFLRETKAKLL